MCLGQTNALEMASYWSIIMGHPVGWEEGWRAGDGVACGGRQRCRLPRHWHCHRICLLVR